MLKAYGELPENAKINETDTYGDQGEDGIGFEFDEGKSDDVQIPQARHLLIAFTADRSDDESGDGKEVDIDEI